ncbi:unnamed protein product [Closterium sp. Naga37s-1]|nr:unnamed protein product [Closterium sp. Naga37s-1]
MVAAGVTALVDPLFRAAAFAPRRPLDPPLPSPLPFLVTLPRRDSLARKHRWSQWGGGEEMGKGVAVGVAGMAGVAGVAGIAAAPPLHATDRPRPASPPVSEPADPPANEPADLRTHQQTNQQTCEPASKQADGAAVGPPSNRTGTSAISQRPCQPPAMPPVPPLSHVDCGCGGGGGVEGVAAMSPLRFPTRPGPVRLQWQSLCGGGRGERGDGGTSASNSRTAARPSIPLPSLVALPSATTAVGGEVAWRGWPS